MKKLIPALFCLIVSGQTASAQNWIWSEMIGERVTFTEKGLLTDNSNKIYHYGSMNVENPSGSFNYLADTTGSFLKAYSPNGDLLFTKRWMIPFYIHQMNYDGNNHFYFAASFYGSQVIDGIPIVSYGNGDALPEKWI